MHVVDHTFSTTTAGLASSSFAGEVDFLLTKSKRTAITAALIAMATIMPISIVGVLQVDLIEN